MVFRFQPLSESEKEGSVVSAPYVPPRGMRRLFLEKLAKIMDWPEVSGAIPVPLARKKVVDAAVELEGATKKRPTQKRSRSEPIK
jgi:hypothetical protein